jgi:hypothetical protein
MCPSYVRIRLPLATAMARFAGWIGLQELGPAHAVKASQAVNEACTGGIWRGVAVLVHAHGEWTIFDDLTGYLASIPAIRWRELAVESDLLFAGYNDSIPYGQLIVVSGGEIVREFLEDLQNPRQNVDHGSMEWERESPINGWIAVASFVDDDEQADQGAEEGLLWIFLRPTEASLRPQL